MSVASEQLVARLIERGIVTSAQLEECRALAEKPDDPSAVLAALVARRYLDRVELDGLASVVTQEVPASDTPSLIGPSGEAPRPPERRAFSSSAPSCVGRFEIRGLLGRGGMGAVYKAWDPLLSRMVAVKVMHELAGLDPRTRARFQREARTAARLRHPGIVQVHEVGDGSETFHIVMDYIEGTTLREWIRSPSRVDLRAGVRVLIEVAAALHYAHGEGLVHRDVKPENILLDAGGHAFLSDFGLARGPQGEEPLTVSGTVLGTPGYMAPEQAESRLDEIQPATDLYAVGAILYEVLTGAVPFRGNGFLPILERTLRDEAPLPSSRASGVPRDIEAICMKCLEKDPRRRYANAQELGEDLRRFLAAEPVSARPVSRIGRLLRRARRHRSGLVAGAVVAGLVLALGAWSWNSLRVDRERVQGREEALKLLERARPAFDAAMRSRYDPKSTCAQRVACAEQAEPLIVAAIERAPDLAYAHYLRGWLWELREREDRAEPCWEKVIELDPSFSPAHFRLGRLLLYRAFFDTTFDKWNERHQATRRLQWTERARGHFQAVAQGDAGTGPGEEGTSYPSLAAAMGAYVSDDDERCREICQKALSSMKESQGREEFYLLLALATVGDPRLEAIEEALRIRPTYPVALLVRSNVREVSGDYQGAIEDCSAALEQNPNLAEALQSRGWNQRALGNLTEALADLDAALQLRPHWVPALTTRGETYAMLQKPELALADYTAAIEAEPDRATGALLARAELRWSRKEFAPSIADLTRLVELADCAADPLTLRAYVKFKAGDNAGAVADLKQVLKSWPDRPDVHWVYGKVLVETGEVDEALSELTEALRLRPDDGLALHDRGWVFCKLRRYQEAIVDLTRAIDLGKDCFVSRESPRLWGDHWILSEESAQAKYAECMFVRGVARSATGDLEGAIADFGRCLELRPTDHLSHAYRAQLYLSLHEYDQAIQDFRKSIALAPPSDSPYERAERGLALAQAGAEHSRNLPSWARKVELGSERWGLRDPVRARLAFEAALAEAQQDPRPKSRAYLCALHLGLARVYAQEPGAQAQALDHVAEGIRLGGIDRGILEGDLDLTPLHEESRWKALFTASGPR